MRKFKAAGKKRTNYIYYTAEGGKVEITPNEDGMDETWITLLHGMDDEEMIQILEEQEQVDKVSKLQDAITSLQLQQIALI